MSQFEGATTLLNGKGNEVEVEIRSDTENEPPISFMDMASEGVEVKGTAFICGTTQVFAPMLGNGTAEEEFEQPLEEEVKQPATYQQHSRTAPMNEDVDEHYAEIGFEVPEVFTSGMYTVEEDKLEQELDVIVSSGYGSEESDESEGESEYLSESESEVETESDCDSDGLSDATSDTETLTECDKEERNPPPDTEPTKLDGARAKSKLNVETNESTNGRQQPPTSPRGMQTVKERISMLQQAQAQHKGIIVPQGAVCLALPRTPGVEVEGAHGMEAPPPPRTKKVAGAMNALASKKKFPRFFRWRNNRSKVPVRLTETVEW